jgi:hypothetical protein
MGRMAVGDRLVPVQPPSARTGIRTLALAARSDLQKVEMLFLAVTYMDFQ